MILSLMQNGQARRDFLKCGLTENCFIISLAEQLSPKMEQCLNLVFIEEKFILEDGEGTHIVYYDENAFCKKIL